MTGLLVVLAALAGYCVFVLVTPGRPCRKCGGWGSRARRRRVSACPRCKGTGTAFRPGARLVHRGAAAAWGYVRGRLEGGG